jgi:hypothetical protein
MAKAATAIAMAAIVDAIVDAVVNVANVVSAVIVQQVQLPMPPRIPRVHVKQNPVKKAVVAIAMVAPSVLKLRARMQTLQAPSQAMLHLQLIAIQQRMAVSNARVAVATVVVVVAGNVLSAAKVPEKQMQR